ncbi:MAG: hypothetical protein PWQ15_1540 [Methanobacterium sp.]|jgi:hypothetical protein|uniref:hypothetical protein n=1 Tax=Methanobacterium sp. TaxID=2164 RepID=UPI0003C99CFC|nr:hypothetical protein [Methanobacterium sp.]MDI3550437.1 hypothetical protein [Methanobacterium sp.]CDG64696.1 hypothetical protein MBMB1_0589 [Methanobacterium sp. MB1]
MSNISILFSHILPPLLAFAGIILLCSGIMDRNKDFTIIGIVMFFAAGLLPFLVLQFMV